MASVACSTTDVGPPDSPRDVPTARHLSMTREQVAHAGIRWGSAEATLATEVVEMPGQLAPNEDRTARLGAPARGRVQMVHVHIGERVVRDQPLVTLAGEQAHTARAEHLKAMADLGAQRAAARYSKTALDRAERLLELKAISRQDVEKARVDHEEAESALAQAEAEVDRARATLAQLGVNEEGSEMVVRAPLAGLVLSRDVVPGSVVEPGDTLVTISDPSTLWLDISVTEQLAPGLRPGSRVRSPSAAGRTFDARIAEIGAAFDPATRTLPVHAEVENPAGVLGPAMFATVMLPLGAPRPGVTVPDAAVQLLDERAAVFVIVPDETVGRRSSGAMSRSAPAARSGADLTGLQPGDVVVIGGVRSEVRIRALRGAGRWAARLT
jgi:cobalt-zinc-cadmium efflux system membrane fusion protein